jgi:hypothetical protein
MAPGKAPGPDGLPPELWRKGGAHLYPLLASLFSAIGQTGAVPPGFLEGMVSPYHKAGDHADISNYRPITLLNTDYRLMTKVLALRLAPVLASVIGPEQTAFMPGRHIGDTVTFLQLLPQQLRSNAAAGGQPASATVAFLDFKKAYDTVNRAFLLAVMDATGAGPDLIHWVRTILSATSASANVNGHISQPVAYHAGVRQGCPVAPLLYLFVAWALSCWLRDCPAVGLELVSGKRVHCAQYADDAQALLRSLEPASVQEFLQAMAVFERASGQCLNLAKTSLMPVGDLSQVQPLPAQVASIKVVQQATTLGITFSNDELPDQCVMWQPLLERVSVSYAKLCRLPLSMFGRAFAGSGYGISRILYHAEFSHMPGATSDTLQAWTTRLVDRAVPPHPGPALCRKLPGVPSHLLPGRPAEGGMGALPWRQHILARHAMWARRLLAWLADQPGALLTRAQRKAQDADQPPAAQPRDPQLEAAAPVKPLWVDLAECMLSRLCPGTHPCFALLSAVHASPDEAAAHRLPAQLVGKALLGPSLPIGPLSRMAAGLRALGAPGWMSAELLQPGEWCASAPLWGNPLLQLELRADQRTVRWGQPAVAPNTAASPAAPQSCSVSSREPPMQHQLGPLQQPVRQPPIQPRPVGPAAVHPATQLHWDTGFACMAQMPGLCTVGDLVNLARGLHHLSAIMQGQASHPGPAARYGQLMQALYGPSSAAVRLPDMLRLICQQWSPYDPHNDLTSLVMAMGKALPDGWLRAAISALPPMSQRAYLCCGPYPLQKVQHAVTRIVEHLGWPAPISGAHTQSQLPPPILLCKHSMSVRSATALQMGPVRQGQRDLRAEYVTCALSKGAPEAAAQPSPQAIHLGVEALESHMRWLWHVRWENAPKETLWRLSVNGIPGAGGHSVGDKRPCACGWQPSQDSSPQTRACAWRTHCFWDCTVATAVVGELAKCLPGVRIACADVWLLRPPAGARVNSKVWAFVAMVALHAMAHGRRVMWACLQKDVRPADQSLITDFFPVVSGRRQQGDRLDATQSHAVYAAQRAAVWLWCLLQDFVCLKVVPGEWLGVVPPDHPFIGVLGVHEGMRLNLPSELRLPDDLF